MIKNYKWILASLAFVFVNVCEGFARNFDTNLNEYYVSVKSSASGGGSSWSDAMSFTTMIELLEKINHHCVIHMEKGRYDFTKLDKSTLDIKHGFTLLGGYSLSSHAAPSSPSDTTLITMGVGNDINASLPMGDSIVVRNVKFRGPGSEDLSESSSIKVLLDMSEESPKVEPAKVVLNRCFFGDNFYVNISSCKTLISECDFECDTLNHLILVGALSDLCRIESCSFSGRLCIVTLLKNVKLYITNCTFVGNDGVPVDRTMNLNSISNDSSSVLRVSHNTILGSINSSGYDSRFENNIIYGTIKDTPDSVYYYSHKNVYLGDISFKSTINECFIPDSLLFKVFNHWDSAFVVKKNSGDYTRTIPLIADHYYADKDYHGTLRSLSHIVDRDQLGRERYACPCFGAYEIPFNQREKYYVKTAGSGLHDGSDWSNALDTIAFNYILPFAPAGSEFHFAEGVYTPMSEDVIWNYKTHGSCFTVNNPVSFIGGYSRYPSKYEKPDPLSNEVIFSGDVDYNDAPDGTKSGVNSYSILVLSPRETGRINVSGIKFKGAYNAVKNFWQAAIVTEMPNGIDSCELNVEKCVFDHNNHALFSRRCFPYVNDCVFENVASMAIENDSCALLKVSHSAFVNCYDAISSTAKNVEIDNSTFINNVMDLNLLNGYTRKLMNNTVMDSFCIMGNSLKNVCLTGNILNNISTLQDSVVKSQYNLIFSQTPGKKPFWASSSDTLTSYANLLSAFELDEDSVLVVDYVKITDDAENPFTPTLNLLKDTLDDGISLRFPLQFTEVKDDQRHASRRGMTCVGAFELDGKYPILSIPTAFTPYSRNGKNDVFMKNNEVYIYNRYGQLICHSEKGWDGRCRGELVEPGVYLYAIIGQDEVHRGTIEVIKSK